MSTIPKDLVALVAGLAIVVSGGVGLGAGAAQAAPAGSGAAEEGSVLARVYGEGRTIARAASDYVRPPTPYRDRGKFDPGCPDVDVVLHYDYVGVESLRRLKGSKGQAFLVKDRVRHFKETWVEKGSGGEVLFTWRGQHVFEETGGRRVPKSKVPDALIPPKGLVGPIYRFRATEKGWSVVRDGSGDILYDNGGTLVFSSLFDTLGDRQPGGTRLNFRVVRVLGPHPFLDVDPCELAADLANSR